MEPCRSGAPARSRWVACGIVCVILSSVPPVAGQVQNGCRVFGRVVDRDTQESIPGATVFMESADIPPMLLAGRASSADGTFSIVLESCASDAVLHVEMLGYDGLGAPIAFDGPGDYSVTLRLVRRPMALEELTVSVPKSARLEQTGFYARKAWVESTGQDLADFYDPDEFQERRLKNVPEYVRWSRIRFVYGGCEPSVYVDGRLIRHRPRMNYWDLVDQHVRPSDVEGMEVYRSISTAVPLEFRDDVSSSCGAVLVWTKKPVRH